MLAVDAGNTRLKIGFFSPNSFRNGEYVLPEYAAELDSPVISELDYARRVGYTDRLKITEELLSSIDEPQDWFIAQTGKFPWNELQKQIAELRPKDRFIFLSNNDIPLETDVDNPASVGLDRLLAAFAALKWRNVHEKELEFGTESPVVIADAGTALTVDLLTSEGHFGGGVILPGLHSLAAALPAISPKLPHIEISNPWDANFPAKNTEEACIAGVVWGTIGVILHFYETAHRHHHCSLQYSPLKTSEELPNPMSRQWLPLLLTGGDTFVLWEGITSANIQKYPKTLLHTEQYLVLSGIAAVVNSKDNNEKI
jgi:type III pantothenate kinase